MTSVSPIGANGLAPINGDLTATQFVNGATVDTNNQTLRAKFDALIAALGITIRDDNLFQDAVVRLRSLDAEVIALLGSGAGNTGIVWQPKVQVACATTANITLSGEQTIDGVLTSASRVLVKDQTLSQNNGIYVSASGAWTRATDADTAAEIGYAMCYVAAGTVNLGVAYINTLAASAITLGTTGLSFARLPSSGLSSTAAVAQGGTGQTSAQNWPTTRRRMVRVVAVANVTVSGPGATLDSVTLAVGDRVLLTAQSAGAENGIWSWNGAAVPLTRTLDYPAADAALAYTDIEVLIREGTIYAGATYRLSTTGAITIDTTATTWVIATVPPVGMRSMARYTYRGRQTVGTGVPEDLNNDDFTVLPDAGTTRRDLSARFAESYDVLDWGAAPYGGNWSSPVDSASAIQAAIDAATILGKQVKIPQGSYYVSVPLVMKDYVHLVGVGLVTIYGGASGVMNTLANAGQMILENITLTARPATTPAYGLKLNSPNHSIFRNVYVSGASLIVDGITCEIVGSSYGNHFDDCRVEQCTGIGLRTYAGTAPTGTFNQNLWTGGTIQNHGRCLSLENTGKSLRFRNADIEGSGADCLIYGPNTTFEGCWIELGNAKYLDFKSTAYGSGVHDCRTRGGSQGSTAWGYRDLIIDRVLANTAQAYDVQYCPVGYREGGVRARWITADRLLVLNGANIGLFDVPPPLEIVGYRFWVQAGSAITTQTLQIGNTDFYTIGGATTTLAGIIEFPIQKATYSTDDLEVGLWWQNAAYVGRFNANGRRLGAKFKTTQAASLAIQLQLLVVGPD